MATHRAKKSRLTAVLLGAGLALTTGFSWTGYQAEPAITDSLGAYGISLAEVGQLSTAILLGLCVSFVFFGVVGASIDRRRAALLLELVAAVGWLVKAHSVEFGQLRLAGVLIGLTSVGPWLLLGAVVDRLRLGEDPHGRRAVKVIEEWSSAAALVMVVATRVLFVWVAGDSVRSAYCLMALTCVVSALIAWRIGPDSTVVTRAEAYGAFSDALSSRYAWGLWLLQGVNGALLAPWDLFSQELMREFGGGDGAVNLYGVAYLVAIPVGVVLAKLPREAQFRLIYAAFGLNVVTLAGVLVMLAAGVHVWWPIVIAGACLEAGTTTVTVIGIAGAGERQTERLRDAVRMLGLAAKFGGGWLAGQAAAAFVPPLDGDPTSHWRPYVMALVIALLGLPVTRWVLGTLTAPRHRQADPAVTVREPHVVAVLLRYPGFTAPEILAGLPLGPIDKAWEATRWAKELPPGERAVALALASGRPVTVATADGFVSAWVQEVARLNNEVIEHRSAGRQAPMLRSIARLVALETLCSPTRLRRGPDPIKLNAMVLAALRGMGR